MKRVLCVLFLVIILVCISWLKTGFAQQLTPEQIKAYEDLLNKKKSSGTVTESRTYQTPPIFEENDSVTTDSLNLTPQIQKKKTNIYDSTVADTISQTKQLVFPQNSRVERFGQNLFNNPQVNEINTAAAPDDYLLGPGDNIIISLWGRVQQEWNLTVDRQGKIFIPKVGEITAWGMTLGQFENHLNAKLSRVYTGYNQKVTLGKIRTIKVFVYGEVVAPGGYAISALSTLFNALAVAGGPSENGSFRQIKLIRGDKTSSVDLYDFLVKGDKRCDLPLSSGDVIFVPLVGRQATIRGAIKRPAIYELAGNEKISDLLALAGGPTADAYMGRLMLDRISEKDAREVIDLDFTSIDKPDSLLVDGDDLSVFSVYQMRQNFVWVNGMVKHPGTFERTDSMRVSNLLERGQLLPNNVYMKRADLYRHHRDGGVEIIALNLEDIVQKKGNDDILLNDLDSLHIYNTNDVERKKYVSIDGLVRNPGRYPLYDNMTVSDLIFIAGNLKESAYMLSAELARIDGYGKIAVFVINLDSASGKIRTPLKENDRLFIRKIPGYEPDRLVMIEGEVYFPGQYSLTDKDETLWSLLNRAGGFTAKAFPAGTVFRRRQIVTNLKLKNIPSVIEASRPLVADSNGVLQPVETFQFRPESMDRIIIDMPKLIASNGAQGDFTLQAGDYIYVPETPSGISIMGEVGANGTIRFEPGKKVKYYIDRAGGLTRRADKRQIRLVEATGRVYSGGNILRKNIGLGDVIIVPSEIKKEKDWLKYITVGTSIITGAVTTAFIIDRM